MAFDPSVNGFSIVDYIVFVVMLMASLGIGVYHCFRSNKTTEDFLLAGRSMSKAPIVLSLVASYISSITLLGVVGEVYGQGMMLIWSLIGLLIGKIISTHVFFPIIYSLHLSSINEYLELRFRSPALKRFVLLLSCINSMLYLGICLFAPTLALEAVTPFKSSTYVLILGIVVTLYSAFGGLKAVVWTDAFQSILIVLGVVIANMSAIITVGGLAEVWRIGTDHGRTEALDFGFGLHTRHTAFNTILMETLKFILIYSFNQSALQRVNTMPDYSSVKQILYFNCFGLIVIVLLLYLTGLSVFAVYAGCDPISMGYINRKDQIFPYYVMDYLGYMKGVPGAFVACLFSGTMSSISSVLNSVPCMLWSDFLSHIPYFVKAPEHINTLTNKLITLVLGIIMIGLAFMASNLGGLVQATGTVLSILGGPIMGVFVLGFCVPICNKKGAFGGLLVSLVFMTWLAIGSQLHGMNVTMLPLSTDRCENVTRLEEPEFISTTMGLQLPFVDSPVNRLSGFYGISYTFLLPFGLLVCVLVGISVSLATGRENLEELDPAHVLHCLRRYVGVKSPSYHAEVKPFLDVSTPSIVKVSFDKVAVKFISGKPQVE